MRIGKVLELQFKDITKTGSGMRKVGITARAVEIYKELFKYKQFNELDPEFLERDFIFTNKKEIPFQLIR